APVEFAHQIGRAQRADGRRPYHVQFESGLSITGANADLRLPVAPSALGGTAVALLVATARRFPRSKMAAALPDLPPVPKTPEIDRVAAALAAHPGASLVVTGSEDPDTQTVVAALNALLGNVNVGATVDLERPSLQRQGDGAAIPALAADMEAGRVGALVV